MLNEKARQLTWMILARLKVKNLTSGFDDIYPHIFLSLSNLYIRAREDAVHKVKYEVLSDLSIYFPDA